MSGKFLHTMLRVGDLDRSVAFYTKLLGMKELRRRDVPDGKYTLAFLGYGEGNAEGQGEIELTYNYGVDSYELVIADGTCTLSPSPAQDPKLAVTVGPVDFLKVIAGVGNPMMMFMTGKLKAKGDLGLAANIANLFDIPKA